MSNIPEKLTGFRYWCYKVLPLVYDDSLSYYELLCKVVKKLNETIENTNQLNDNVQELLTAFNQLQNYVANYFDNLDVQSEINAKLDQMVQDGDFDRIISRYITYNITRVFNTTTRLQEHDEFVDGQYVQSLGYSNVGDGGASTFIIVPNTNPLASRFGFTTATEGLSALPVALSDDFNVAVFGAIPNQETTETVRAATKTQFEKAIDFCKLYNKNFYVGKGYYAINSGVLFENYSNVTVKNYGDIFIQPTELISAAFLFKGCENLTVENKGSMFSAFTYTTAQATSFYNARRIKTSSNLQCFNVQGCNNFTISGGNYSYFEYVVVTQMNYNDNYKLGTPPSGASAEEKLKYRFSAINPTGWQDNSVPDTLRSHNVVIDGITAEFVFMPFYHEHVHNLTIKNSHILAYSGAGRLDHIVYTSQCVYKCFILNNVIENDNLQANLYEVDGVNYWLGCWFAFNLRNGWNSISGYESDTLDEGYVYNNTLNDWTNGYISALGSTVIHSANNVVNFSEIMSATNDEATEDKRNRKVFGFEDSVTLYSSNDDFYNPCNYGLVIQSFRNNAYLDFESCKFIGFTEIGEGTALTTQTAINPNYIFNNCTFYCTQRLFYIENRRNDCALSISIAGSRVVSDFVTPVGANYSTLFSCISSEESPCYLTFINNYCSTEKSTGGVTVTQFYTLQTNSNINISRNTFQNYTGFVNAEFLGAVTFNDNIRIRNNVTYNSDEYLTLIDTTSTIYIDSVSGNDLNNGTQSYPLKTLTGALNRIKNFKTNVNITLMDSAEQVFPAGTKITGYNLTINTPENSVGTITTNNVAFYNSTLTFSNIYFTGSISFYNCALTLSTCNFLPRASSDTFYIKDSTLEGSRPTFQLPVTLSACNASFESSVFGHDNQSKPLVSAVLSNIRFITSTSFTQGYGSGASLEFIDCVVSLFGTYSVASNHKTMAYLAVRCVIKTSQSVLTSLDTAHGSSSSNSTTLILIGNVTLPE